MCICSAFNRASNSNCRTKEVGDHANLLSLNFYVLLFYLPSFQCFEVVHHEIPFVFSVMSAMPKFKVGLRIRGWPAYPFPRLDQKVLLRLTECDDVIRGPPTLSPPLIRNNWQIQYGGSLLVTQACPVLLLEEKRNWRYVNQQKK